MSGEWGELGGELDSDSMVISETDKEVKKPRLYAVVMHNDHYTTMEFVVQILTEVFHHSEAEAERIMLTVHRHGQAVAGVYSFEIAETKVNRVIELARRHEYPLRCSLEPA
jgi:ATP-dependent Clp protease adaptor protein ClpS